MSMAHTLHTSSGAQIAVWWANGAPARIVFRGVWYRVTDTPTRLEDEAVFFVTHPLPVVGWRFQGTDPQGQSLMFDIRPEGDGWALIRAFV